jgi:hypothetical protein
LPATRFIIVDRLVEEKTKRTGGGKRTKEIEEEEDSNGHACEQESEIPWRREDLQER